MNAPMLLQAQEILECQPLHGVPVLPQIHELQLVQLLPNRTQWWSFINIKLLKFTVYFIITVFSQ